MPTDLNSRVTSDAEAARAYYNQQNGLNADGTPVQQNGIVVPPEGVPTTPVLQQQQYAPPVQQTTNDESEAEQLRRELAKTQQDYNSLLGRVAPAQQAAEEARRALQEAQRIQAQRDAEMQRQVAELQEQLNAQRAKAFNPRELLSEEEASLLDDTQLAATVKIAEAIARRQVETIKAEQEQSLSKITEQWHENQRKEYIRNVLSNPAFGLDWVRAKANDVEFNQWLESDDGIIANQLMNNFLSSPMSQIERNAKMVAKELGKFPGHPSKAQAPVTAPDGDIPNRLAAHATRQSSAGVLNDRQIQEKITQAKQLSASRNPKDKERARAILDEVNAQFAKSRS